MPFHLIFLKKKKETTKGKKVITLCEKCGKF